MRELIIIGKLNASETVGFWKAGDKITPDVDAGDYAIVENKGDYDLVKILGIIDTWEKYSKLLAPGGISKKAVNYLARSQVRKD